MSHCSFLFINHFGKPSCFSVMLLKSMKILQGRIRGLRYINLYLEQSRGTNESCLFLACFWYKTNNCFLIVFFFFSENEHFRCHTLDGSCLTCDEIHDPLTWVSPVWLSSIIMLFAISDKCQTIHCFEWNTPATFASVGKKSCTLVILQYTTTTFKVTCINHYCLETNH